MRRRIVKKFQHERVPVERLLHDSALHPGATPMDEPHFAQSFGMCLVDVLFDDRGNVSRREGVEVELALDGDSQRVLILHGYGVEACWSYRTVTSVLMPPRTEKSPTTVMRRG
jgi:hypothetical protein